MYKVFVGDKPIILTTVVEKEHEFKNYLLDTVNIGKVIKELNNTSLSEVRLIHKNKDKLLKKFLKKLPNVIAGGGKAFNDNNEILFIYRNDKWDLPKGKAEGKVEGKVEAANEIAKKLLSGGVAPNVIAYSTGLSPAAINAIAMCATKES